MLKQVRLISTAHFVPGDPIPNEVIFEYANITAVTPDWVESKLGIKTRHVSRDWNNPVDVHRCAPGCLTSDIASNAGLLALEKAGMVPNDIDMLIVSTTTPDFPVPGTANFVQEKMGIENCATMDIRSACCGAFQAFTTAMQYCQTGSRKNVMIIGADVGSVFVNFDLDGDDVHQVKKDCVNAFMFGDGAGAIILRSFDEGEEIFGMVIEYSECQSVGYGISPGFWMPSGGCAEPFSNETIEKKSQYFAHDFRKVLEHGPELYLTSYLQTTKALGLGYHDFDVIIPHQANGKMAELSRKVGIPPEKLYINFDRFGNTANASTFICLSEITQNDELNEGDRIYLIGAESTKWLWGSIVLRYYPLYRDENDTAQRIIREKAGLFGRTISAIATTVASTLLSAKQYWRWGNEGGYWRSD